MAGPSKPSVTDEVLSDARVKSFLEFEAYGSENADYVALLKAYRGLRAEDFERFLRFFVSAGKDIYAKDSKGRTIWDSMVKHRMGAEFLAVKETVCGQ